MATTRQPAYPTYPMNRNKLIMAITTLAAILVFGPMLIAPMAVTSSVTTMMMTSEQNANSTNISADPCSNTNTDSRADTMTAVDTSSTTAINIAKALAKAGYSKASTAGVLGNIQQESSFNPRAQNAYGYSGLVQTQVSNYEEWFAAHGLSGTDWKDEAAQIRFIVEHVAGDRYGWNNVFKDEAVQAGASIIDDDLYETWRKTGDPEHAAVAWMMGYERAGDSTWVNRKQYARSWYDNGLGGIEFTGKAASGDTGSSDAATAASVSCSTGDSGSAEYGSIGGAPIGPRTFDWMCSTEAHICHDGDSGPFPPAYGYQCWWYALTRLWMIHGHDISNDDFSSAAPNGLGGYISQGMEHKAGWTADSSPHPGDGVSQLGGALGGTATVGHVAVVEEVKQDAGGWKIRISEGNYGTDGSGPWTGYNSRWLTQAQFKNAGNVFFRKTSWK